jgi:3D (Asp-Asp-Asp) domain-containing protein
MITILKKAFWGKQTPVVSSILAGFIAGVILFEAVVPQVTKAQTVSDIAPTIDLTGVVSNGHLTICKLDKEAYEVVKTVKMVVTAYSSTPDQTDDTPFITASGETVADGIVANNMLPFGAKIRMPELFGDKVFVVEDRMARRKGNYHVDVWLSDTQDAKEFGAKITYIEVLES